MFVTKSAFEDLPESLKIHGSAVPIGFSVQGSVMAARFVTGNCPRKILAALAKAAARLLPDINTRIDQGLSPTDQTDYKKLKALAAAAVHILNANSALFSKSRPRTTIDILASWRIYAAQQQRVTGTIGWYDRGHFNFSGYRIGYEYHPAYYDTLDQFVLTNPAKDGKDRKSVV